MLHNILFLYSQDITDNVSWACDWGYFIKMNCIQILALAFLGYCDIAFLRELDNASIKFKWLLNCELLMLFYKKISLFQILLFCICKDNISQKKSIISLKVNNTKVVRDIAL